MLTNKFIKLGQDSLNQKMIFWYSAESQTKNETLNKVPLFRKSVILIWNSKMEHALTTQRSANNMGN